MRVSPPKWIELVQLQTELVAAGVSVTALGVTRPTGATDLRTVDSIFTYDQDGSIVDLPPAAAGVITAHVAQPTEFDLSATDLNTNYQTALTRLDAIIAATTLTQAQTLAAIQDEARMLRRLLRFVFNAVPSKR